jgi:H/ACA ribonucleoprotein complex subunit 3
MDHLLKCLVCGSYGLGIECPCGKKRVSPLPAKFSPEDKYAAYRRKAKAIEAANAAPAGPSAQVHGPRQAHAPQARQPEGSA